MLRIGLSTLITVVACCVTCPLVLAFARRFKVGQPILGYVTNHFSKSGTPTMGGIAFLLSSCLVAIAFNVGYSRLAVVSAVCVLGFGMVGFLDDYIKIKGHDNKGLSVIQKLIAQFLLAGIVAYFAYSYSGIGGKITIPFTNASIDIGWWAVPVYTVFVVGVVNFVNLTDGLDGLVATTGCASAVALSILIFLTSYTLGANVGELNGLSAFSMAFGFSLATFYVLNSYPAKIFMGDTGSLGTGALLATVSLFSGNMLDFLIIGIVYVVSGVSVVLQVGYFKLTHKRIFKMAPFHHHLERCGIHENKIVAIYALVTLCCAIAVISLRG